MYTLKYTLKYTITNYKIKPFTQVALFPKNFVA